MDQHLQSCIVISFISLFTLCQFRIIERSCNLKQNASTEVLHQTEGWCLRGCHKESILLKQILCPYKSACSVLNSFPKHATVSSWLFPNYTPSKIHSYLPFLIHPQLFNQMLVIVFPFFLVFLGCI